LFIPIPWVVGIPKYARNTSLAEVPELKIEETNSTYNSEKSPFAFGKYLLGI